MKRKRGRKPSGIKRPVSPRGLILAIKRGAPIDSRTRVGKAIRQVKEAVQEDLDLTAKALLEQDVAHAAVIQQMALEKVFADPETAIGDDGKHSYHLGTWSKYGSIKRSSLLALKKFQQPKSKDESPKNLGDLIIETSDHDTDADDPDDNEAVEDTDQSAEDTTHWSTTLRHGDNEH